jgi:hypothetical protein
MLVKLIFWLVVSLVVVGVVGGVGFVYLAHRDKELLPNVLGKLGSLAESLEGKEHEGAAERVRELQKLLEDHGSDIEGYGGEIDQKLSDLRKVSESAYQAAKKQVDSYRNKDGEEASQEKAPSE